MSDTYELPWIAARDQRDLTALVMIEVFHDEIRQEGVGERVDRFIEEFGGVAGAYKARLTVKFKDNIPAEVSGILGSFAEHVSDIRQNDMENMYHDDMTLFDKAILVAKMAAATTEVRALNEILGL